MNRRHIALEAFLNILTGQTLHQALKPFDCSLQDESWIIALLDGCCRHYFQIKTLLNARLLNQPLAEKDRDIECLLILALYELGFMRSQAYATVNEWVELATLLNKISFKALVNAICRRYEREKDQIEWTQYSNNPSWLSKKYRKHYIEWLPSILEAQDQKAPLFLRVNLVKITVAHFLKILESAGYPATITPGSDQCIRLDQACSIRDLPGYTEGWFYVQDYSAQFAAELLECHPNQTVLDLCAAPGGKTLHLLERESSLHITATDSSPLRIQVLQDNLARCGGQVEIIEQDMTQSNHCFTEQQFDRILLDAPCSGTGVIRRHPEIKLIRNSQEIEMLCQTQAHLLNTAWPLLKPRGILLYATCSLLPEENEEQILRFINEHSDAQLISFTLPQGMPKQAGWQLLPQRDWGDGFYYAKILKSVG